MKRSLCFTRQASFGVCCASVESSCARDIEKIERVQRKALRIPIGFDKLEYENRFKRFSLTTMNDMRLRGD